jgi:hypothetical protein
MEELSFWELLCASGPADPPVIPAFDTQTAAAAAAAPRGSATAATAAAATKAATAAAATAAATADDSTTVSTGSDRAQFHQMTLKGRLFRGDTYRELVMFLLQHNCMALGLYRPAGHKDAAMHYAHINPSPDERLFYAKGGSASDDNNGSGGTTGTASTATATAAATGAAGAGAGAAATTTTASSDEDARIAAAQRSGVQLSTVRTPYDAVFVLRSTNCTLGDSI